MLTALLLTQVPAIRAAIAALLQSILSQSILFQEDNEEPNLWLRALPDRLAERPDTDIFQGGAEGLIIFLDDCVQRCLKTPYRYVEALHALGNQSRATADTMERLDMFPSPLIMTIIEQLDAKINNKSLAPSHLLGAIIFLRKVLINLSSKTLDLHFLQACARNLDAALAEERLLHFPPVACNVARREVAILHAALSFSSFTFSISVDSTPEVEAYLSKVEQTQIRKFFKRVICF